MGPSPAVAEIRNAVRASLAGLADGQLVLAACSGGADSLALAAALAFVAPRAGLRGGAVTVDHGLQAGSAQRAAEVAAVLRGLGLDPVHAVPVTVPRPPRPAARRRPPGPPATPPWTRPPPAPGRPPSCSATPWTTRPRPSCSGWPAAPAPGRWPACPPAAAATGGRCWPCAAPPPPPPAPSWAWPPGRTRTTATTGSPGPGSATRSCPCWRPPSGRAWPRRWPGPRPSSAPTPTISTTWPPRTGPSWPAPRGRHPADPADPAAPADPADPTHPAAPPDPAGLAAGRLLALPAALRTRLLHQAALAAGCPRGALTAEHVQRIDELVTSWHGQRGVDLPGGVRAWRRDSKVWFTATTTRPARGGESIGRT